jgi:hypothetical protein
MGRFTLAAAAILLATTVSYGAEIGGALFG